jgi:hypothetical protein
MEFKPANHKKKMLFSMEHCIRSWGSWVSIVSDYRLDDQGSIQGRGVHVTGVSAAYTFKWNKNILSE